MTNIKIFTSGKMGGLNTNESMNWRENIEKILRKKCEKRTDINITFVHPPKYYNYDYPDQKECEEWEIMQLTSSDIVIVHLHDIKDSIGTHMELGILKAIKNKTPKPIYVVGLGEPNVKHPWIDSIILHKEKTATDLADYIINYILSTI